MLSWWEPHLDEQYYQPGKQKPNSSDFESKVVNTENTPNLWSFWGNKSSEPSSSNCKKGEEKEMSKKGEGPVVRPYTPIVTSNGQSNGAVGSSPLISHGTQQKDLLTGPLSYGLPVGLSAVLVVFSGGSLANFAALMLMSTILVSGVYFAQRFGTGLALIAGLLAGQIMQAMKFSLLWYPFWAIVVFSATLFLNSWNPSSARDPSLSIEPSRQWLSMILHGVIKHVSPLKIPQFDIGGQLPKFTTRSEPIIKPDGFALVVDFEYHADSDTKIEIEIPMTIPLYGTLAVPVMVNSPQIAGTMHVDYRTTLVPQDDGTDTKVLAIAILFEGIKEIHLGGIHVSVASQFHLLQYIPIIRNQMKQAINMGLIPGTRRILLFDTNFSSLGSFELPEEQSWDVLTLLNKNHVGTIHTDPHPVPILDLTNTDPDAYKSTADPPMFQGITEIDADLDPALEPGDAHEVEPSPYPQLVLR